MIPADLASFTASTRTAARARCHSRPGVPIPVENHISSQHPGLSEIALKLDFHISLVAVSFALSRIDMSGRSHGNRLHESEFVNATFHASAETFSTGRSHSIFTVLDSPGRSEKKLSE